MHKHTMALITIMLSLVCLLVGCAEEPAYMHPYGEGVDPNSVVTKPYQTVTTTTRNTTQSTTTTTIPTVVPTQPLVIPEGHVVCPTCEGVKLVCDMCFGTGKCKVEIYNPEADLYVRKYAECTNCSSEDPGFMLCETCENRLYIEE